MVEAFRPEHLDNLRVQASQSDWASYPRSREYTEALASVGTALTVKCDQGIVMCGGVVPTPLPDTGELWSLLTNLATADRFMFIDRGVRRFIRQCGYRYLQSYSLTEFSNGCRWLRLLGFSIVGHVANYGPLGRDYYLYRMEQ